MSFGGSFPREAPGVVDELERYIRARYPLLYIVSWEEERMIRMIDDLCKGSLKKATYLWSCTEGLYNAQIPERKERAFADPLLMLDEVETRRQDALYLLLDFHPFLKDHRVVRRLRDLARRLRHSRKTIILLSPVLELPIELQKECVVLDAPLPDREELARCLDGVLQQSRAHNIPVDLKPKHREKLLNAAQGLTFTELENVMAKILLEDRSIDERAIAVVMNEKRQIIRKSGILEFYPHEEGFDDVGGLEALKRWLTKRAGAFGEKARRFGIPVPKGLLIMGIQGCGKSLMAKAIATQWNLPLLRLDIGRIFSSAVGASEENTRLALRTAESVAPCILWIDELEKGFSGIESSNFSDAGTAARVFGSITTWLQEKEQPVFVVASANDIGLLPPELLRKGRFDEIFFVDLPNQEEREAIFKVHLRKRGRSPKSFDLPLLAQLTEGFSGAEIEQVVISALYDAFDQGRHLSDFDLVKNIKETIPLSRMMEEQISFLREWAGQRARRASS
ncbi:MAG: AAA family ATPase [Deltaproteobacteria bacterium]|nr:MAG: AAA family ATPase [Deltaproteobacteria bacterium]